MCATVNVVRFHLIGIIRGPLTIAVWKEQERFYMFDPNERSKEGKAIEKPYKKENEEQQEVNVQNEEGAACVIWFIDLKELAQLYINNTPREKTKDFFVISNVEIQNVTETTNSWNSWTGKDSHFFLGEMLVKLI